MRPATEDPTSGVREISGETTEVQLPFRFYEGATSVTGTVNGVAVTGIGFAELLHAYEDPTITITSPINGTYDPSSPITWDLDNPDDGRPVFYDLEYSDDNQNTFNSIATDLTNSSYLWDTTPLVNGDDVIFRITSRSIDGELSTTTLSPIATLATLSLTDSDLGKLKTYPNPVSEILKVDLGTILSGSFTIVDVKGRMVTKTTISNKQVLEIDTTELQSGVYILNIETVKGVFNLRFIKQ